MKRISVIKASCLFPFPFKLSLNSFQLIRTNLEWFNGIEKSMVNKGVVRFGALFGVGFPLIISPSPVTVTEQRSLTKPKFL